MRATILRSGLLAGLVLAVTFLPVGCSSEPEVIRKRGVSEGDAGAAGVTGPDAGMPIGLDTPLDAGPSIVTTQIDLDAATVEEAGIVEKRIRPSTECAASEVQGTLNPANLLFVVDQSGSMNCNLPEHGQSIAECELSPAKKDPSQPSKWELTKQALSGVLDVIQESGVEVTVGMSMFPEADSLCGVPNEPNVELAPLVDDHNATVDAFLETVVPNGNTPLAGATILSYAHLFDHLREGGVMGNVFVVLMTDGFETCKVEELEKLLGEDVPNAFELLSIRTFVIGAPGSEEARSLLSQIAWAGGTASSPDCLHDPLPTNAGDCHFDMTESKDFAADLAKTLRQISVEALACELDVPKGDAQNGVDLDKVNVDINGDPFSPTDCSVEGNSGWQYTSNRTRIVLCGQACEGAKQDSATVSIVLGCPTRLTQ
ncbi:hypothetical protein ACFL5O_09110 [Myxococcota bacterium]